MTARARIRSAALDLFSERGFEGASIRDVAKRAGVSPGLVQHHFGTKERLCFACDDLALREITRIEGQVVGGELENPALLVEAQPELLRFTRYVARSMVDGSEGAAAKFAEMVRGTESEGNLRLSEVKLEFYSTPLLSNEFAQHARASIDGVLGGSGRDRRPHASRRGQKRSSQ